MPGKLESSREMGASYPNSDEDDVRVSETSLWDLLRNGEGGSSWGGLKKGNVVARSSTSGHDIKYEMPQTVTKKSQNERGWEAFPGGYCDGSFSVDGSYQAGAYMSDDENEDSREVDYGSDGADGDDSDYGGAVFDYGLDSDGDGFENDLHSLTDNFAAQRLKYRQTERLGEKMAERAYNRSIMQATVPAGSAAMSFSSMDVDGCQKARLESSIPSAASRVLMRGVTREELAERRLAEKESQPDKDLKLNAAAMARSGRPIFIGCKPAPKTAMTIENNPLAAHQVDRPFPRRDMSSSLLGPSMIPGSRKRSAIAIEPPREQGFEKPGRSTMDNTPTAPGNFVQFNPALLQPYMPAPTSKTKKLAQRKVLSLIKALQPIKAATTSSSIDITERLLLAELEVAKLKAELDLQAMVSNEDTEMEL